MGRRRMRIALIMRWWRMRITLIKGRRRMRITLIKGRRRMRAALIMRWWRMRITLIKGRRRMRAALIMRWWRMRITLTKGRRRMRAALIMRWWRMRITINMRWWRKIKRSPRLCLNRWQPCRHHYSFICLAFVLIAFTLIAFTLVAFLPAIFTPVTLAPVTLMPKVPIMLRYGKDSHLSHRSDRPGIPLLRPIRLRGRLVRARRHGRRSLGPLLGNAAVDGEGEARGGCFVLLAGAVVFPRPDDAAAKLTAVSWADAVAEAFLARGSGAGVDALCAETVRAEDACVRLVVAELDAPLEIHVLAISDLVERPEAAARVEASQGP
ncbi:hypothetical protein Trco_003898 [Trichoderma cornu-damae]|uniref:Uncharacterized protein n=1 Tax=Trichoderma cornu-damae TaxID=654480 RepID=A0A9P8QLG3_9HYPO|nr:hypothetical protein Trco_003898 [Trichoderma cornu-damae]